jgi:hypothetical protein
MHIFDRPTWQFADPVTGTRIGERSRDATAARERLDGEQQGFEQGIRST